MKELFTGIYSHFAEDPLAAAVSDMYNTKAPSNATFPYIVFSLVVGSHDIDSSQYWENPLVQFNIFSNEASSDEVCDIYNLLKGDAAAGEGYDYFELLVDDYNTVIMQRTTYILMPVEKVWQYTVTYRLMLTYTGESATARFIGKLYNLVQI